MGVFNALIARAIPLIPRSLVWRVARRYIAGLELGDAARLIQGLKNRGFFATVDLLGENVTSREEAIRARDAYCAIINRLHEDNLPAGISVKPTQLGLRIDPAIARENLEFIASHAADRSRFVRIDMEDSSTTDSTVSLYRELRGRFTNVGMALQSYLHRSYDDARALLPLHPDIRICKGIYREPARLALQGHEEIRQSFLRILQLLLSEGARVAIATHDEFLIEEGLRICRELGVKPEQVEFQMLLGVGDKLWPRITASGYRIRIYVPFGKSWYAYSVRRLRENPKIAGYVLRGLFRL